MTGRSVDIHEVDEDHREPRIELATLCRSPCSACGVARIRRRAPEPPVLRHSHDYPSSRANGGCRKECSAVIVDVLENVEGPGDVELVLER